MELEQEIIPYRGKDGSSDCFGITFTNVEHELAVKLCKTLCKAHPNLSFFIQKGSEIHRMCKEDPLELATESVKYSENLLLDEKRMEKLASGSFIISPNLNPRN